MSSPPVAARGVRALRRLLGEQTDDLRRMDLAAFRRWLDGQLAHWRADPVFAQRTVIRDLRRAHPRVRQLEREHRRAAAAEAESPEGARRRKVEEELAGVEKAVAGLTAALERSPPEKHAELRRKLDRFQVRRQTLRDEQARLAGESPHGPKLLRIGDELRRLLAGTGLEREQARLDELLREQGRRSGRSGAVFERLALALTRGHVVPELARGGADTEVERRVCVLRGVTLGAARVELDQVVVRRPRRAGAPVQVLAVVEVKRNLNDLGKGFRQRQENLAWLTGDASGYAAEAYRTRRFRSGHFDRGAVHRQDGEELVFARESFRRFRREPGSGLFLRRLYFVTRAGPLWGVSSAALARIRFRVATDERCDPESDACLADLLRWCRSLAYPLETPDVLRAYAAAPRRARQVLVVSR